MTMKTRILTTIAALALCASALAQTNTVPAVGSFFSPLLKATNWIVAPYVTYAPDVAKEATTKLGGGVLAIYNISDYIGAGLGVDWLGQFSLVSGNVQLKLPLRPLAWTGWSWATNWVFTPFAIGGLATPLGGAGIQNGAVATIEGAGAGFRVARLLGGDVDIGGAMVNWTGAGPYSGRHYEGFLAWKKSL